MPKFNPPPSSFNYASFLDEESNLQIKTSPSFSNKYCVSKPDETKRAFFSIISPITGKLLFSVFSDGSVEKGGKETNIETAIEFLAVCVRGVADYKQKEAIHSRIAILRMYAAMKRIQPELDKLSETTRNIVSMTIADFEDGELKIENVIDIANFGENP